MQTKPLPTRSCPNNLPGTPRASRRLAGWSRPRPPRALVASLAILALLTSAGCFRSMEDLDRDTDLLVQQRSKLLGGGGISPTRTWKDPADVDSPAARATTPSTTDPAANQLTYTPADEARDVATRLSNFTQPPVQGLELDITSSLRQAQQTGRELLNAEEEYILTAIRLLIQRHLWSPRFFATISPQVVSQYARNSSNTTALQVVSELRATQRLPYGGELEARYVYSITEQLRTAVTDRYESSSNFILSGTFPLLRGAGDVAREDLIQAERELVYAARTYESFRRAYLVSIARDYFQLLQQQREIENQENALKQLKNLEQRTAALVEAGRQAEFQKNIASNDVLVATSRLASQRESYILALDRFKVRLGLNVNTAIVIKPERLDLPEPEITPEQASTLALDYRLDLQTRRDRVDDQRRGVRNAKNALLPDFNVFGSANLGGNNRQDSGTAIVNPDASTYTAGVTFGLPLDRETERLQLRSASIALQQALRTLDQFRDEIVVDARSRVREIERARFALQLAERAVQINRRRLEEQELKADTVTAQDIVDTANSLRDAENSRDQAVTDLRNAILDYLLATGQLRVTREGTLDRPPGMEFRQPTQQPEVTPGTLQEPMQLPTEPAQQLPPAAQPANP